MRICMNYGIIWIQFLAIVSCFCSLSAVPFQAVPSQFPSVYLSIQLFYIHANLFPCCQVWRGEDGLPQSGWLRQDSQCCHWSQGFRPNLSRQAVVKYFSICSGLWIQIPDPHGSAFIFKIKQKKCKKIGNNCNVIQIFQVNFHKLLCFYFFTFEQSFMCVFSYIENSSKDNFVLSF